ncbi:MAG: HlyD family efflux transporter periplasmic adaptor subunit [Pseudomonadota bacterium]|nr:MAG: glycoside hydrolase family 43 [Pseudomonadota bacterium]
MTKENKKRLLIALAAAVLAAAGWAFWQDYQANKRNEFIVSANGRIEAVEIDVAAKTAGRVAEILVREGEFVTAGQVVARIDTEVLEAQLRAAEAELARARAAVATARSQLAQRRSEKATAQAVVEQRKAELDKARSKAARSEALAQKNYISRQAVDDDVAVARSAEAALRAAEAQVAAAEAGIANAQSQIVGAESAVRAAEAQIERIRADIKDAVLRAPRDGRVQYRVAQVGEVVAAGGRVLNLLDLSDVYMTFFLPTTQVGRVPIGAEVRLIIDAAPQYVIPAKVSFIADEAQFTPKTVETRAEREKLMFRLRAQIPEELLRKHIEQVKTGLPGTAYVRLDQSRPWPPELEVKLPQ